MLSPCRDLPPKRAGSPHSDCRCCARDGLPSDRLSDVLEDGHRKLASILRSPRLCDELNTKLGSLSFCYGFLRANQQSEQTGKIGWPVSPAQDTVFFERVGFSGEPVGGGPPSAPP